MLSKTFLLFLYIIQVLHVSDDLFPVVAILDDDLAKWLDLELENICNYEFFVAIHVTWGRSSFLALLRGHFFLILREGTKGT